VYLNKLIFSRGFELLIEASEVMAYG